MQQLPKTIRVPWSMAYWMLRILHQSMGPRQQLLAWSACGGVRCFRWGWGLALKRRLKRRNNMAGIGSWFIKYKWYRNILRVCVSLQLPILGTSVAGSIAASRRQSCADSNLHWISLDACKIRGLYIIPKRKGSFMFPSEFPVGNYLEAKLLICWDCRSMKKAWPAKLAFRARKTLILGVEKISNSRKYSKNQQLENYETNSNNIVIGKH